MKKIPCTSQNTFASLVALDGFHLLLSTRLTANLTPEWSGGSMFHPLSHVYTKIPFCCVETVANNALNCQRIIVFDQLWANTALTLNRAFSLTNVHAKWWIHCFLISPLLSHATSIYDQLKGVCAVFWYLVFSGTTAEFGQPECLASLCLYDHVKISIPPLNHCFWWSRVWITLIKPLLCLKSIFSYQKAMLYQHMKFKFFHRFENFQQ